LPFFLALLLILTFLLVFSFSARDSITISDDDFDVPKETPRKGSKVATDNRPKTSPKSSAKDSPIRRTVSSDGIGLKPKGSATLGENSKKMKQEPESAKNGSLLQKQNSRPSLIRKQSAQKIKELFENMEDRKQEEEDEEEKGDQKSSMHLKGGENPAAKPAEDERKKGASSANGSGSIRASSKSGAEKTKPPPAENVVAEFSSSEEESEEHALLQPGKEDEEGESDLLLHSDDELLVKPNEKFSDVESSADDRAKGETNEFYVMRHNQETEKPSAPPSKKAAPVVPRKTAYFLTMINYNFIHRTKREQH